MREIFRRNRDRRELFLTDESQMKTWKMSWNEDDCLRTIEEKRKGLYRNHSRLQGKNSETDHPKQDRIE